MSSIIYRYMQREDTVAHGVVYPCLTLNKIFGYISQAHSLGVLHYLKFYKENPNLIKLAQIQKS